MAIKRKTYIFSVLDKQQNYAKKLSIYAGKIYFKAVSLNCERYQKGSSISNETIATYIDKFYLKKKEFPMHSQSQQAAYQQYFKAKNNYFKTYKKYRKQGATKKLEQLNPPYKTKKYQKVCYKSPGFCSKRR